MVLFSSNIRDWCTRRLGVEQVPVPVPCRVEIVIERIANWVGIPGLFYVVIGLEHEKGNGMECKLRGDSW